MIQPVCLRRKELALYHFPHLIWAKCMSRASFEYWYCYCVSMLPQSAPFALHLHWPYLVDPFYWPVITYDSLEQDIGIVAACIPAIIPLFRSKRAAKKSVGHLEDQRPLHNHSNKSTPCSVMACTAHKSAETYQTEIGPKSLIQTGEVGLESLDGRGSNVETGIVETVEISHERTVDSVPAIWFAVSHPQNDATNSGQAWVLHGAYMVADISRWEPEPTMVATSWGCYKILHNGETAMVWNTTTI